ncbi:DedA family protein [Rhabdaerophilum calidifontis]|uniref:DedA family protein n=1 Tax=Rhabdaerophilum calidifontis TaxID=2604328 RepID=UPI00123C2D24|nr:DedA family protein [Rhabdaerophilum calidifontis]
MSIAFDHAAIIAFVQANQHLAPLVVFLLAMGETIVIVSVFIPSTFVLFALGGLFAASGVPLMPSLIAGAIGAAFGFSVMYLVSATMEGRMLSLWPFRNYGETIARATAFSRRWGVWGVVIGHFGGPLRVLIPIVAGISRMAPVPFMLANLAGAAAWITVFFAPGYLVASSDWFRDALGGLKRLF